MKPLRVGVVGCGRHATNSIYPALQPAGLRPVAVCARHIENARRTADLFGAEQAYDSVEDLLEANDIEALVVCVPAAAYLDVVTLALRSGLPVFTEKPGGASIGDLERIEAASSAAGVPVMVGYMKRFAHAYRAAKRFVESDGFGPVTSIHSRFVVGPGFGSLRNYLIDNPVHALDLMRYFGGEIVDLESRSSSLAADRHAVSLLVQFESGAVGTAQFGTTGSFFHDNELLEVFGDEHSVTVANVDTVLCRRPTGPAEIDRPTYSVPLKRNLTGDVMGFVPELEHFRSVVVDGVACESDVSSAKRTLELAERVWQQISS